MPSHFPTGTMAALARLVEDEMTQCCVWEREAPGPGTFNSTTGEVTIARTEVYRGKCLLGDRIEGAFTSGGFGANPQEYAYDARTHNAFVRLPLDAPLGQVGDIVTIADEAWRVTARERASQRVSATYRVVRFDADASRA